MLTGIGIALLVVGLLVGLGLIPVDLSLHGDGSLGAIVVLTGLLILAARHAPPHRVVYVQSSRDDRVTR